MIDEKTVRIWWVDLEAAGLPDEPDAAGPDDNLLALLDPGERERAARFRQTHHSQAFIRSHAALRVCLAEVLGIPPGSVRFGTTDDDKPRLAAEPTPAPLTLDFSLSHSANVALIGVVTAGRVGLDVERRSQPNSLDLARRWFALDEAEWLERLPSAEQPQRFLECWTRKEAYLKALGVGLAGDLKACRCEPPGEERAQERAAVTARVVDAAGAPDLTWRFIPLDRSNTAACAVVDFEPTGVVVRDFDWSRIWPAV